MELYEGTINTLNNLPYVVDEKDSWVKKEGIINALCEGSRSFYEKRFATRLNDFHGIVGDTIPMTVAFQVIHEVFEDIEGQMSKNQLENVFTMHVYPFIGQLTRIGIQELKGNRQPLEIMEEMILKWNRK